MSKKWQLLLNLIVVVFVLAMIPFSIWATSILNSRVSNNIYFDVEDIEGSFSYQITGDSNPDSNVAFSSGNVFTASYNEQDDRYVLQNSLGEEIIDGQISIEGNGLTFSHGNTLITYSFLFINSGETDVALSVLSDPDAESNLIANNVATAFRYELFLSEFDVINQLPSFSAEAIVPVGKSFNALVDKKDETSNAYTYILFTYQLYLTNLSTNSFTTAISLDINLHSVLN
jgi:hypothetical protein